MPRFGLRTALVVVAGFAGVACLVAPYWDPAWELAGGPLKSIEGEYRFGGAWGMTWTLEIRPAGRFAYTWGDGAGTYGSNYGGAALDGPRLMLQPRRANVGAFGTGTEFVVVRWGRRIYLVPEVQMTDFCEAVLGCDEPRTTPQGAFYLRAGGWQERVTGLPEVPEPWRGELSSKAR